MPALVALGYVEERQVRGVGRSTPMWFLTTAGREALRALASDAFEDRSAAFGER